ncbi:hypothetical protein M569_17488, partial [Genlisea aurea]
NSLPPGLVSNLQQVLLSRKNPAEVEEDNSGRPSSSGNEETDGGASKPIILVTNSEGIESPGLSCLVDSLVREGAYDVFIVVPQSDKTMAGHSLTLRETVEVASVEVNGAVAFEISGSPADCVSLALSGALFSWSKPLLVISGVNKGSSCGSHIFHSGVIAGAREALLNGVPSISISQNWVKDESLESDFKDAVAVSSPIITAVVRDIRNGVFPQGFFLDVELPCSPLSNKGIKVTKRSFRRYSVNWQAISSKRNQSASRFAAGQPGIGMQFAQLSRDASAAGAARRFATQKKDVEVVESVGAASKSEFKRTVKYYRAEEQEEEEEGDEEDLDFRAVENGFISVSPVLQREDDSETGNAASKWISSAL